MLEIILSFLVGIKTLEPAINAPKNPVQIVKLDSSRPLIRGDSALVADLNSDTVIFQKNGIKRQSIASLTKLMTAYIIIQEHKLNEIVTITELAANTSGSSIGLQINEQQTVENLLKGLLIQSGNDAAVALAIYNSGTVDQFVQKMNHYSSTLNLQNTKFQNPMGFDDQDNYSTAQDLYTLAKEVYSFQEIQEIVQIKSTTISSIDGTTSHRLDSTNLILDSYLQIGGLKTGTTAEAGGCFIGITINTPNPHIAIILGSNDRFLDTKVMLDWAKNTFKYK
jgi:D-alanyl-D-alanine carboxypeptidase